MIIILGKDFVSREAIRIERDKSIMTDIPINRIDITTRFVSIVGYMKSLNTNIPTLHNTMQEETISKEAFTRLFVSPDL
jgi:hypothetical protein